MAIPIWERWYRRWIEKMRESQILKVKPIRDFLAKRPTLILKEPIVRRLGLASPSPRILEVMEIDAEIKRMLEEKKKEWKTIGASPRLIEMAEDLAEDWAWSMAAAFAPPELRTAVAKHAFPKGLEVATRWVRAMVV